MLAKSAAVCAALAGIVAASPVDITGKSKFTVKQVAVANPASAQHPAKKLLKAYKKYGALDAVPTAVAAAAASGSVTANPTSDDSVRVSLIMSLMFPKKVA